MRSALTLNKSFSLRTSHAPGGSTRNLHQLACGERSINQGVVFGNGGSDKYEIYADILIEQCSCPKNSMVDQIL